MQSVLVKSMGLGSPLKASANFLLGKISSTSIANGWYGLTICKTSGANANRYYATAKTSTVDKYTEPEKSVFISQSSDIHTNLALEDWIYRNFNFENHRVLLLWRNDPCVVIGRHQNPWTEVDVSLADESKLTIARRNSGGGCVYHDQGNLNCTFFTPRDGYDRKSNLEVICRALKREFGIEANISPRQDVNIQGYKISGTAAKLGKNAYHHCTLLVDANLKKLSSLLNPNTDGMESRATKSIKSAVKNLKNSDSNVSVEKVLATIGYEFLRTDNNGNDGGEKMIEKQRGFQMINPTNEWFPGLEKIRSDFKSWDWNYGKTPEFSIHRTYPIGVGGNSDNMANVDFLLKISKGRIEHAMLELSPGKEDLVDPHTLADLSAFINAIRDRPFHMDILATFEGLLFKNTQVSLNQAHRDMQESLLIA